jgi:hypothetical protein
MASMIGFGVFIILGHIAVEMSHEELPSADPGEIIDSLEWEKEWYKHWADTLQYNQDSILVPYIQAWEDHGMRMRMIAGYPPETPITWEWKCIQPVETTRIVGSKAIR